MDGPFERAAIIGRRPIHQMFSGTLNGLFPAPSITGRFNNEGIMGHISKVQLPSSQNNHARKKGFTKSFSHMLCQAHNSNDIIGSSVLKGTTFERRSPSVEEEVVVRIEHLGSSTG